MFGFHPGRAVLGGLLGALATLHVARAQSSTAAAPIEGSRSQLEAAVRDAESQHHSEEAFLLRTRLRDGDFQEGDRIIVSLQGPVINFTDSLVVRSGKILPLPDQLGDLSLNGVLRSELNDTVTARVSGLILHEVVHATPLVRLSIQGAVSRPGYYDIPADVRLSDVVTKAGGTTPNADTKNVVIRRGDEVIWAAKDVQTALTDGLSVDRLNMRAGDEITVGIQHPSFPWQVVLGSVLSVVGLLLSLTRK